MGESCLLLAGWDGRNGWDGGGMELPTLEGANGVPPFSLEMRQATGSGGRKWEVVDATNFIGAARARSICVISAE